ncbi:hypothetical protein [Sorangium sp. So ce233]|uniref:hypothetical protein n=1 Tax=Sorangium sp. So ce233 TaxID=3133290 RepID=UPI003F62A258
MLGIATGRMEEIGGGFAVAGGATLEVNDGHVGLAGKLASDIAEALEYRQHFVLEEGEGLIQLASSLEHASDLAQRDGAQAYSS